MFTVKCNYCGADITFDKKIRTASGKAIPLNLDKTPHDCPESPYNKQKKEEKKE